MHGIVAQEQRNSNDQLAPVRQSSLAGSVCRIALSQKDPLDLISIKGLSVSANAN
jgi:hypothetical protein